MTADQKKILAGRMESQTLSKNSASNPQELVDTIRKEDMSFKGRNSLVNLQPMSKRAMTQLLSEVAPETCKKPQIINSRRLQALRDLRNPISNAVAMGVVLNPSPEMPFGVILPQFIHNIHNMNMFEILF
jgi:hypothetical protein